MANEEIIAITRKISRSMNQCLLTHQDREPLDLDLARAQHMAYEACLAGLGLEVISLAEEPDLPDSVFVEDTALVLDEAALITRPGAPARRPETASVAAALEPYRPLTFMQAPGTLDGGDLLVVGKTVCVGLSSRSNRPGIDQLEAFLKPHGYTVQNFPIHDCLHLKSAVTCVAENLLLLNPEFVDPGYFPGVDCIEVDPAEPGAANALRIREALVYSSAYPRTRKRLEARGLTVHTVNAREVAKSEGAVTCCSLIFKSSGD